MSVNHGLLKVDRTAVFDSFDGQQFGTPDHVIPQPLFDSFFLPAAATHETQVYAVIDASDVPNLVALMTSRDAVHQCLFQGDTARDFGDHAP